MERLEQSNDLDDAEATNKEKLVRFRYKKLKEGQEVTIEEKDKNKEIILEVGVGGEPYFFVLPDEVIGENQHYVGIDLFGNSPEASSEGGIDILKEKIGASSNRVRGRVDFFVASGEALPMRNKGVSRIVFRDIFGAPESYFRYKKIPERGTKEFWRNRFVRMAIEKKYEEMKTEMSEEEYYVGMRKHSLEIVDKAKNRQPLDEVNFSILLTIDYLSKNLAAEEAKQNLIKEASDVLKDGGEMIIIESRTPDIAKSSLNVLLGKDSPFQFLRKDTQDNIATHKKDGVQIYYFVKKIKKTEK